MTAVVAAARRAVGVRFRVHGRDPAFGLDCVGLVALALRDAAFEGDVPDDYALRGGDTEGICAQFDAAGLTRANDARAGDILLCASGAGQFHLAIDTDVGVIHADAAARRVVERPGAPPWPVIGRWRFVATSRAQSRKDGQPWQP